MAKKRATFVLGSYEVEALRTGEPITEPTLRMLDRISEQAGVDADIVFVIQDIYKAGKSKAKQGIKAIRAERARVLSELNEAKPDVVICFGPVATACIFDKGNAVEGEMLRRAHHPFGADGPPVYVTFSIENAKLNPGLQKWLGMDVEAAVKGWGETKFGDYTVLLPGMPEWENGPFELQMLPAAAVPAVGLDLETFPGLDPWHPEARIRMVVVSHRPGRAWVVQATPDSRLPEWVIELAVHPLVIKAGSNIKFDARWMRRFGYDIVNMDDTSVLAHIVDGSNPKKGLKELAFWFLTRLGDYSRAHRDLVRERGGWEFVADNEQYQYCGGDGEVSIAAWQGLMAQIKMLGRERPYRLMHDLYPVLADMETNGTCIDVPTNRMLHEKYVEKLTKLRAEITAVLGPINIDSHDQLAKALVEAVPRIKLGVGGWKRVLSDENDDEDEELSTKRAILEREAAKHPVIQKVLEYRKYRTRHSTFIAAVHDKHMVRHPDGQYYVHATYRPDVVQTYRLSSQAPNDQNTPRKDKDDPELSIKKQVKSRFPGGKIAEADQAQIEIRFAAWASRDENMIAAIKSGEDIHRAMAAIQKNKPAAEITDDERTESKTNTFLAQYGGGAKKLAAALKVSVRRAAAILKYYFETFWGLDLYIKKAKRAVHDTLAVTTHFGFERKFHEPQSWDSPEGWGIERQAFNTMIQNGAGCLTYVAAIYARDQFIARRLRSLIIKMVHDSIVVDVYPGEEDAVARILHEGMVRAGDMAYEQGLLLEKFDVPLACEVKIGDTWATAKAVEIK